MHARMLLIKAKPGQVKELAKALTDRALPILRQQPGFIEALALSAESEADEFVGISIWKTKEAADNYVNGPGRPLLQSFSSYFAQPPDFRMFNVEGSTIQSIAAARAATQ